MSHSVDLVVAGHGRAALTAASDALRRGRRVLVVLPTADRRVARRLRRELAAASVPAAPRVIIMTNAEIVCVDGVHGVEAVVIRSTRTGRLCAVNASAIRPLLAE